MQFPRITLITPSFNQGKYLQATIDSVLSQNYPDLEYIVIVGGSTDRSVDIIRCYETHFAQSLWNDPRLLWQRRTLGTIKRPVLPT
jgi:GT2 family glycosyltransferase